MAKSPSMKKPLRVAADPDEIPTQDSPEIAEVEAADLEPATVSPKDGMVKVLVLERLDLPPQIGNWTSDELTPGRAVEPKTQFSAPREIAARLQDSGRCVILE